MTSKTTDEFWCQYTRYARKAYLSRAPLDRAADPLLGIFYDVFSAIDTSIDDALKLGYTRFTPTTRTNRDKTKRMLLIFSGGPSPSMSRQVPFQQKLLNSLHPPFRILEFVDLKIALQSIIANEGKIKPK